MSSNTAIVRLPSPHSLELPEELNHIPQWIDVVMQVLSTGKPDLIWVKQEVSIKLERIEISNCLGIRVCVWSGNKVLDMATFMVPRNSVSYLEMMYPLCERK